jgi:hypothetical protein
MILGKCEINFFTSWSMHVLFLLSCYQKKGKYWKAIQLGPQGVGRALFANFISVLEIQELNSVFPKGLTSFKFDKLHQDRVSTLLHCRESGLFLGG